jgi:hypothetical protein
MREMKGRLTAPASEESLFELVRQLGDELESVELPPDVVRLGGELVIRMAQEWVKETEFGGWSEFSGDSLRRYAVDQCVRLVSSRLVQQAYQLRRGRLRRESGGFREARLRHRYRKLSSNLGES